MYKKDLFSIIITNFNCKDYIIECIYSVLNSHYRNFEIIVVDNGSTDGSVEALRLLEEKFSQIKLVKNKKNLGPAKARNQGLVISNGEFIAFLDSDTKVSPLWLDEALNLLRKNENIGALQCKLILEKEKTLDSLGEFLGQFGFLVNVIRQGEEDRPELIEDNIDILSAKGAGMIFRKVVLEETGAFDEDYFIYMEETDVCWRAWLIGYQVKLCKNSLVYHRFGTTSVIMPDKINYLVKFHGTKNYIYTLLKNLSLFNLLIILPIHVFLWFAIALFFLSKFQLRSCTFIMLGIGWNLFNLPSSIKKRNKIQKKRKISDRDLFRRVFRAMPFRYYLDKFFDRRQIGRTTGWDKGE